MAPIRRAGFAVVVLSVFARPGTAQSSNMSIPVGGPFSRDTVLDAPFAAEATTHVMVRLPDGSAGKYTVTARYYRDSQGRVRAEMDTPSGVFVMLEIPPGKVTREHNPFYVLDPVRRVYTIGPGYSLVAKLFNGEARVALPVKIQEPIRARFCFEMAPAVSAASDGERLKTVAAQVAPDLGIVIASHRSDAIGSVDYQVTNIRRGEPSADLFDVLTTYSFVSEGAIAVGPWQSPPACGPTKK